jgi:hypothetical protein
MSKLACAYGEPEARRGGVKMLSFSISRFRAGLARIVRSLGSQEEQGKLGDFTTTPRVIVIALFQQQRKESKDLV